MLKFEAYKKLPPFFSHKAFASGIRCCQPVEPETTGMPFSRQYLILSKAASGWVNSMATSALEESKSASFSVESWAILPTISWFLARASCSMVLPIFPYPISNIFISFLSESLKLDPELAVYLPAKTEYLDANSGLDHR